MAPAPRSSIAAGRLLPVDARKGSCAILSLFDSFDLRGKGVTLVVMKRLCAGWERRESASVVAPPGCQYGDARTWEETAKKGLEKWRDL